MTGPLKGFRVLELTAIGPVPFAGALLADMGADVVRVDRLPPQSRSEIKHEGVGRPVGAEGQSAHSDLASERPSRFDFYNRNKRSVALDLKRPEGVQAVLQLLKSSDVLLEGFRPGVTERLGLGPVPCFAVNQRLIYGRMTGWGQDGPIAQEAGHDINYLALTGALHSIGVPGLPPVPPLNLVADLGGGAMYLAVGVLAAAMEARSSGQGQVVDAAMIDGVVNLMSAFQAMRQLGTWTGERAGNIVDGGAPYYGTYETRDGKYVAIGAMEPQFYAALLDVLGLSAEALPPQNERQAWPQMRQRFADIFRTRSRAEWVEAAQGRDACLAPVLSIDEAPHHPQMRERKAFTAFDEVLHPSPAPRFSRTPGALRRAAPAAGQHSSDVLADWGLSSSDIDSLLRSGVTRQT
jgi:alpha-methylacyl-CoA racemase